MPTATDPPPGGELRKEAAGVRRGRWVVIVLTAVAGYVDAVGYLVLRHLYTANMSGNSVAIGVHTAQREWSDTGERAFAVGWFVAGLVAGGILMEVGRRQRIRRVFSLALAIEAACLASFVLCTRPFLLSWRPDAALPSSMFFPAVALATFAMGLQDASLTKTALLSVHTTFVTGSLVRLAQNLVALGFWFYDRLHGRFRRRILKVLRVAARGNAVRQTLGLAGLWIGYVAGAVIGALVLRAWGALAMTVPIAVLLVLAWRDPGGLPMRASGR